MSTWILLVLAVACEVFGAVSLKLSEGFSKPMWVLLLIAGYGTAFYLFSHVIKTLPLGLAYTAWAGLGAVGTFVAGWIAFGEAITFVRCLGSGLVLLGVAVLNFGR